MILLSNMTQFNQMTELLIFVTCLNRVEPPKSVWYLNFSHNICMYWGCLVEFSSKKQKVDTAPKIVSFDSFLLNTSWRVRAKPVLNYVVQLGQFVWWGQYWHSHTKKKYHTVCLGSTHNLRLWRKLKQINLLDLI